MSTKLAAYEVETEEADSPERDLLDRRIMELQDLCTNSRLNLLAYLLEQLDAGEVSRYEAFRAFVKGTNFSVPSAKRYIILMGGRGHEAQLWETVEAQYESL